MWTRRPKPCANAAREACHRFPPSPRHPGLGSARRRSFDRGAAATAVPRSRPDATWRRSPARRSIRRPPLLRRAPGYALQGSGPPLTEFRVYSQSLRSLDARGKSLPGAGGWLSSHAAYYRTTPVVTPRKPAARRASHLYGGLLAARPVTHQRRSSSRSACRACGLSGLRASRRSIAWRAASRLSLET